MLVYLLLHLRQHITDGACKTLAQAFIMSHLDYANALLYGVSQSMFAQLQRVQNTAARLVTRTRKREHITPVLMQLHWLPVEHRPTYKILLYVYKALHDLAPAYMRDMLQTYQPARPLRSGCRSLLSVPRTHTVTYGNRSFRKISAELWNNLPGDLKSADSVKNVKKQLKTYLYRMTYN